MCISIWYAKLVGAETFEIFRKCEECKITTDILLDSNARTMDENDQGNPEAEVKFKHSFDTDEILGASGNRKKYDAILMHSPDIID